MRVVLDTNVLFSALFSPAGVPGQLVRVALAGRYELIVSPKLLDELRAALARPKSRLDPPTVARYVGQLEQQHLVQDPAGQPATWTRDPDDDYLIALAVASGADAIVTGDRDLTELVDPPVSVLTPRAFLDQMIQDA